MFNDFINVDRLLDYKLFVNGSLNSFLEGYFDYLLDVVNIIYDFIFIYFFFDDVFNIFLFYFFNWYNSFDLYRYWDFLLYNFDFLNRYCGFVDYFLLNISWNLLSNNVLSINRIFNISRNLNLHFLFNQNIFFLYSIDLLFSYSLLIHRSFY